MFSLISLLVLIAEPTAPSVLHKPPVTLEPMVVVSTRSQRPLSSVAGVVTVIDAARSRGELVGDLEDLARYEVGFSAETAGTRFGFDGFNIRGMGGNRLAIQVDGVPANDHFDVGSFASAGRGAVDPEFIQRTEILRGPASVLYGSDAIGGVVAMYTWDPASMLGHADRGATLRSGFDSADDSWFGSAVAAAQSAEWSGLFGAVVRRGEQHAPSEPVAPIDHVRHEADSQLIKGSRYWPKGKINVSLGRYASQRRTDVFSLLGQGRFRNTTRLVGDDELEREFFGVRVDSASPGKDAEWQLQLFAQWSETLQRTGEERRPLGLRLARSFSYAQDVVGLSADRFASYTAGATDHRVGLGLQWTRTGTQEMRDALQTDLEGQNPTRTLLGEEFPRRDFPNSNTEEMGLWVQDEIDWGRWTFIPALRYERYSLKPRTDEFFATRHPETTAVQVTESQVTPRLGVLYHLDDRWKIFGQYSRGFRAPPFDDANIGLDIPLFGIRAIPNPDLVAETSDSLELGLRHVQAGSSFELALFHNEYRNFIQSRHRLGLDPSTGLILFQSRNLLRAQIQGAELRYQRRMRRWPSMAIRGAAFWARGTDRRSGATLPSVDPAHGVLALDWASPSGRLGTTLAARATRSPRTAPAQFRPPSSVIADAHFFWVPAEGVRLRMSALNLGDQHYFRWQDVRGLDPDHPVLAMLARPGRYLVLHMEYAF